MIGLKEIIKKNPHCSNGFAGIALSLFRHSFDAVSRVAANAKYYFNFDCMNKITTCLNKVQSRSNMLFLRQSSGQNSSLPTPQSGHVQSSGSRSNDVPGFIPLSVSPSTGS